MCAQKDHFLFDLHSLGQYYVLQLQEGQHSLLDADSIHAQDLFELKNVAATNQLGDSPAGLEGQTHQGASVGTGASAGLSPEAPVPTEAPVMAPPLDGSAPPAQPSSAAEPQPQPQS